MERFLSLDWVMEPATSDRPSQGRLGSSEGLLSLQGTFTLTPETSVILSPKRRITNHLSPFRVNPGVLIVPIARPATAVLYSVSRQIGFCLLRIEMHYENQIVSLYSIGSWSHLRR
jgi:hypothetical protein